LTSNCIQDTLAHLLVPSPSLKLQKESNVC
jgi:hypothetical protein